MPRKKVEEFENQKLETKKKTTKKTTTKANTDAVKKETKKKVASKPKEAKKDKVKEKVLEEIVKPVELAEPIVENKIEEESSPKQEAKIEINDNPILQESKPVKDKKTIVLYISIALNIIFLVAILFLCLAGNKKIALKDIYGLSEDNTMTLKLPNQYQFCDNGGIIVKGDQYYKTVGYLTVAESEEEEFDQLQSSLIDYYNFEETSINGNRAFTIEQVADEDTYYYTFIYKNNTILQLVLINEANDSLQDIIKGIN